MDNHGLNMPGRPLHTNSGALVIGGHFSQVREDTIRHRDDFRLHCDGVPMSIANLREYFKNGRLFRDAARRRTRECFRPYQQLYYSALHLYSLLRRNGFEVLLLNCHSTEDPGRLELYSHNPHFVIISTTYMNMEAVRAVVADVRTYLPESIIIVGGNYVHHSYLVWKKRNEPVYRDPAVLNRYFFTSDTPVTGVDFFIYDAHGERTLVALIEGLCQGKDCSSLPNTICYREGEITINREASEEFAMDDYPVSWKTLPRELLSAVIPFSMTYGCPFSCGFCNFAKVSISRKSFEVVFQELRAIAALGIVQKIWFTDDNFLLTPAQVERFCRRFIDEGLPFTWMSFIRASSITPRTAELMKKSGAELLILGLESGSEKMLHAMRKRDTIAHYQQALSLLFAHDIDTELSFIFGYPGETDETAGETIDFINGLPYTDSQIPYLYLFKFNVAPLSPIFEEGERARWKLEGSFLDYRHATMDSEQVDAVLRRVALETVQPVFNYLDGIVHLEKKDLIRIMRARDTLARAVLAGGDPAAIASQWDSLEMLIGSHFGRKDLSAGRGQMMQ